LRLEALSPIAQIPGGHPQFPRNLGQRPTAGDDQLHGLFLELKIVGLAVRFGFRGYGGFSFSCSPPLSTLSGELQICVLCQQMRYPFFVLFF
jgi:hypothetical protein